MKVLTQQITGFLSTNLLDPHSEWSSVTTYSQSDFALKNNYHYMSVVDDNLNIDPEENTGKWLLWEVANKFAALDLQSKTEMICDATTISLGSVYDLAFSASVSGFDLLAFGAVKGDTLTIVEKDSGSATLETTVKTITNGELDYAHTLHASAHTVEVTVSELTGEDYSSIGSFIGGLSVSLGDTVYNPKIGFSLEITKTEDPSGLIELSKTAIEETLDVDIVFDSSETMRIKRLIKSLEGIATAFIIDDSTDSIYENLFMIAYIDDFTIVLTNPSKTFATISLQEVI